MKQHQKKTGGWIFRKRQAHCLVAQADTQPKPAKELALPTQRLIIINKARNANTQYKTVGVQWFARVWFPLQLSTSVDSNAARKPNRFILSNVMGQCKKQEDKVLRMKSL